MVRFHPQQLFIKEAMVKTYICHCVQCTAARKGIRKRNRVQTYQLRAAKSNVRRLLKTLPFDEIDDTLPIAVKVDYYA